MLIGQSHRDPEFLGFQTRVILDLWGVPFHAMVVFGLVPDFLIKSTSASCESEHMHKKFELNQTKLRGTVNREEKL